MFFSKSSLTLLRSLQWRLVLIFISIAIVLIIPVGLLLKMQVESSYYEEFKNDISIGINKGLKVRQNANIDDIYNDLSNDPVNGKKVALLYFKFTSEYKTFTVIDRKNISIKGFRSSDPAYKNSPQEFLDEVSSSSNFLNALRSEGTPGGKEQLIRSGDRTFFDYAYPLKDDRYILYFRYYSDDWQDIIRKFNNTIFSSTLITIIASLIIGYILSKTITVPIVDIMHKAELMAEGNFDQEIEVKSEDEIGKLTRTFNYMAGELKATLNEISSEKNKIETILNYMTDGVIAFNLKGEIIHANPALKKMLMIETITESFNEFSSKYNLGISFEEVLYMELSGSSEKNINFGDKYLRAHFALFTDEENRTEGIIAVFQDVTEQQKLENMRKEFVANVSHELRTPLTSIKSYTETLLDGAIENSGTSRRFLKVVNSEADRMTRIVKDLLQLSRLDNQQMQWNMQHISFVELVKNCVEKMQIEAGNKSQSLECHVIGNLPEITADYERMEQVVLNILSNAIKYTPNEGAITVYLGKTYNEVYVKVTDTGLGIPKEEISRVFERFYRVDKARSREMGGTGLGLSIAKEIIEAHKGSININSNINAGTEVTVKLPIVTS